ncbi:Leucine-rich repeat-containing protein [Intoshia linei]|uniref:Leucine-rich repeat-containing protein n=1 Tax=Intoshia linei TaxID=1819745 RepID=A0A177BDT7_9BILA|nr:Leucine-rich repeat-containing protein [Intoshia linei]
MKEIAMTFYFNQMTKLSNRKEVKRSLNLHKMAGHNKRISAPPLFLTELNPTLDFIPFENYFKKNQKSNKSLAQFDDSESDIDTNDSESICRFSNLSSGEDNYETDLEQSLITYDTCHVKLYQSDVNFNLAPEPIHEPTAKYLYEYYCKKENIYPLSYLCNRFGEDSLKLRHRYINTMQTKLNTICEELDVSNNYLMEKSSQEIAKVLNENMFINVSNNCMKSNGLNAFSDMLEKNTTLKVLYLSGNQLTDKDAMRLSSALTRNMSLASLDLSYNYFGELGGILLANGLEKNVYLSDLDLSWNCIRGKGASAICNVLQKNTSLEIVDLSWNGLAIEGALELAKSLRINKTLRVLDITHNRLDDECANYIASGLNKNEKLETFLVGMNNFGEESIIKLINVFKEHTCLKLLGIEDISLNSKLIKLIQKTNATYVDKKIIYTLTKSERYSKINRAVIVTFDTFIKKNYDRIEDLFYQLDTNKSGHITLEELKFGLKDLGLRLTNRQMDALLKNLDEDNSQTIEYEELMNGASKPNPHA